MPPFSVNPGRVDPYKSHRFRVIWDGRPVAGISRLSGLSRSTDVVLHRDGGDLNALRKSPGLSRYDPITLERGITHDAEFEAWANRVHAAGREMALGDFRKDIRIELMNEAGQIALAWMVFRCWPSRYAPLPELDAGASMVAIETLVLEHEGWARDTAVQEPAEPRDAG